MMERQCPFDSGKNKLLRSDLYELCVDRPASDFATSWFAVNAHAWIFLASDNYNIYPTCNHFISSKINLTSMKNIKRRFT